MVLIQQIIEIFAPHNKKFGRLGADCVGRITAIGLQATAQHAGPSNRVAGSDGLDRYRHFFCYSLLEKHFAAELENLAPFVEDGLVVQHDGAFEVVERGRVFLRNVAMIFDSYLAASKGDGTPRYSRTV